MHAFGPLATLRYDSVDGLVVDALEKIDTFGESGTIVYWADVRLKAEVVRLFPKGEDTSRRRLVACTMTEFNDKVRLAMRMSDSLAKK